MFSTKLLNWVCVGVLATAVTLTNAGCGDKDDDDTPDTGSAETTSTSGGSTTPATSGGSTTSGGTTTTGGTTTSGGSTTSGGTTPTVTYYTEPLVAPQLLWPTDNYLTEEVPSALAMVSIMFQWTVVTDAADYVLEVDGMQYPCTETSATILGFTYGVHTWTVWAREADGTAGPPARPYTFVVPLRW